MRIVDLETKAYASNRGTQGRRSDKFEELASQLNSRQQMSTGKIARDAQFQLADTNRQKAKMEEERRAYQAEIANLRNNMDTVVRFFHWEILIPMLIVI